jgi:hypothetical protein
MPLFNLVLPTLRVIESPFVYSKRPFLATNFPQFNRFLIRLGSWEYWPFEVVYIPVFVYWLWLSVKARSLFFFSAANPGIEAGGLLGESKMDVLSKIPVEFVPCTVLLAPKAIELDITKAMAEAGVTFPLIAKPDMGERGWRVEKVQSMSQLVDYASSSPVPFLLQALVDGPLELGVFYYRMPGDGAGRISSIVQKAFLSVCGNGVNTLQELIYKDDRALLQWESLRQTFSTRLDDVLPYGQSLELVSIGNHCKGTLFLDASHQIDAALEALFDHISLPIEGFYFGRYDLRCTSWADLAAGRNIKILELNGAGAEPAHIYQPGYSLFKGWSVLLHHWQILGEIARENHRRGVPYMSLAETRTIQRRIKAAKTPNPTA